MSPDKRIFSDSNRAPKLANYFQIKSYDDKNYNILSVGFYNRLDMSYDEIIFHTHLLIDIPNLQSLRDQIDNYLKDYDKYIRNNNPLF